MSATAAQRAAAARALRAGASESQAARKAKVNKRTIQRWKKEPDFAARLHNATRITLGHLPEPDAPAPSSDQLDGLPPSRAWISVADLDVLGSALHPLANAGVTNNCDPDSGRPGTFTAEVAASVVLVELVETPERVAAVRAALAAGELARRRARRPRRPAHDRRAPARAAPPERSRAPDPAATDFRAFLDVWQFTDQEPGQIRVLGEVLWQAQEEFVRVTAAPEAHDERTGKSWVFYPQGAQARRDDDRLRLRRVGDALPRHERPRPPLLTPRRRSPASCCTAVKYGLERLPAWLQLPVMPQHDPPYELAAGVDDRRLAKAYPADKETAVENSCTHGHVDEWARMGNPRKVWQAIEPTMAGSCHIVTTGLGPTNYSSSYWRRCLAGDARHHPCFIGALARPDRTRRG